MDIWKKVKWVAGLILLFVLVLATNLIDRDNFGKVENAIETIYEEVLHAKNKTIELSQLIHDKELAHALNDSVYLTIKRQAANDHINTVLNDCEVYMDSQKEKDLFKELKENCARLISSENDNHENNKSELLAQLESVKSNISELNELHLWEGKKQKIKSDSALDSTMLFTRIEVYALIFLASIILIIIMYTPKAIKT